MWGLVFEIQVIGGVYLHIIDSIRLLYHKFLEEKNLFLKTIVLTWSHMWETSIFAINN